MKNLILSKALLVSGGLFCLFLSTTSCTKSQPDYSNEVVAKVGPFKMTAKEFSIQLSEKLGSFSSLTARDTEVINQTKNSIVQNFVVSGITRDWAQKNNVFVRKETLDAAVADIKGQYPDDIAFRQALADAGHSYESWVKEQQQNLLEKLVVEKLRERVDKPTEKEIKAFYDREIDSFKRPDQVKIQQVVLETEEQAQKIYKQLRAGRKMATLAKSFSISPEGPSGGDLGWISRGTHEMFDTAFRLGVGGRSRVIKSPFGYHIFKVTGRRPAKTLRLNDVRDRIIAALTAQREQEVYSAWLEAELLASKVYKNENLIRDIKVFTRSSE